MSGVRLVIALVKLHVVVQYFIGVAAVFHDCVYVGLPFVCVTSTALRL